MYYIITDIQKNIRRKGILLNHFFIAKMYEINTYIYTFFFEQ